MIRRPQPVVAGKDLNNVLRHPDHQSFRQQIVAIRGVEFFEHAEKVYEATLRFGLTTDTEDITGKTITECEVHLTEEDLLAVLPKFRGDILQVPPMYSAIKVNGQKLYDLARKGREVERQPRPITIHELELLEFAGSEARLRVRCSKGTYIRTLCKDIGGPGLRRLHGRSAPGGGR